MLGEFHIAMESFVRAPIGKPQPCSVLYHVNREPALSVTARVGATLCVFRLPLSLSLLQKHATWYRKWLCCSQAVKGLSDTLLRRPDPERVLLVRQSRSG